MKDEDKSKAELLKELEILKEQDLRESEEKYRNLIESVNESIISVDLQGKLLTLNSLAVSYLGGSAEDYIGKTLWDIFPPKVAEERFAGMQKVIQSGESLVTESYIPFQGKMLCFLYGMQPIKNRAGEIYAVLILASDISEQKQTEEKLKASEEYLQILFDYAPDAYYISDLEGNFVDCNREAERLTGYKKEELIGKNFLKLKLFSTNDLTKLSKLFHKNLNELIGRMGEVILIKKDHAKVIVEISSYTVNIKGRILALTMIRDISDRKKAEEALIESEERYRTIFENTGTAMLVVEEDTTSSMVNSQCEKLSGYSKEEIENKMKWTDFVVPEDLEKMKKYHLERRKNGGKTPTEYEFRMMDKKGRVKDIFMKIGMIPHTKKSVASLIDITARKQTEGNLKNAKDELQTILDSVPAIIFYRDTEDKIIRVSKTSADLLKLPIKDIIGKTTEELFPQEQAEKMKRDDREVIISGKAKRNIIQSYTASDGIRWQIVDKVPYINKEGKINGVISLAKDITEQRNTEQKLQETLQRLQKTMTAVLDTISRIVEAKDPYTAGHQRRVSQLATAIALELNLPQDQLEGIRISSLIHDIGKIGIPIEILSKPTKLSDIEFSLIKAHPQLGYDILKSIDFAYPIAQIVLQHHERLDGSGYPEGLEGDNILFEAKIIGVADTVEAMSSHRPYRPALDIDIALEEISQNRGILYDPEVVDVCLKLFKEKGFKFE
ncbi:MAG TPA: PAS domain S-box protein [Candidatus Atribacteria bacterium]|nr:PAS domain S-box protein [Candidatus Atribacteria bacterium]